MWRYKDSGNPHEKLVRAERHLMRWMDKLRIAEFEYQIERARRISRNEKKASYREAAKMKEIRYCIEQCRAIEKIYNRDSDITLNEFEDKVFNEIGFEITREILAKKDYIKQLRGTRRTEQQRTRRYVQKNVKAERLYPEIPQTDTEIKKQRQEIITAAKEHAVKNKLKDLFPESATNFDANAPEERDFSLSSEESKK